MAGSEKTATWDLDVRVDGKQAAQAAKDLETFKGAIKTSKDAIETHRIALRNLKGTSDEVKSSREALKQKITDEQNAIGRSNIGLRQAKTTLDALSKAAKGAAKEHSGLKEAISTVGGPVSDVSSKLSTLGTILGGTDPILAATVAVLALAVAGFVAFGAAILVGTVSLARFTLESGNVLRAQGLMREAVTLGADDAARFGHQIDALSAKLATPKDKLNELAVSIRKSFDGTRISGQGIVDTLEAVSSASAAAGDDVGNNLKGILERSKQSGRVGINPQELLGTGGPQFAEIAAALAKNMKIGVAQATAELRMGRVPIDEAAAAIKDAVNAKFGEVNAKKLLDLNVLSQKFHENLEGLTRGVNLEPILAGLKQVVDLFSQSTVTGQALQSVMTTFSVILDAAFSAGLPKGISLIKTIINLGLRLAIVMVDVAQRMVDFAHSSTGLATFHGVLTAIEATALGVGVAIAAIAAALVVVGAAIAAPFAILGSLLLETQRFGLAIGQYIRSIDWSALGTSIVEGIRSGLMAALGGLRSAVSTVANTVKDEFKGLLGIHSPSAVFSEYGQQTAAGYAQGVEQGAPAAHDAVAGMGGGAPAGAAPGVSSGVSVNVTFQIGGGEGAAKAAAHLQTPSVLDGITHAIELALRAAGIPTQTAVPA